MSLMAKLLIDWNGDGDFDDQHEDVSGDVDPVESIIRCERGKEQRGTLAPPRAGRLDFTLLNYSRRYSAANQSSDLYGLVAPGKLAQLVLQREPVEALVTEPDGLQILIEGGEHAGEFLGIDDYRPFCTGRTIDFVDNPDYNDRTVAVQCLGILGYLKEVKVSTAVLQDVTISEAIEALLDAAGISEDDRVIQDSEIVLFWWWATERSALDALLELLYTEGPGASLYEDGAGRIVFETRYSRLTQQRSAAVQFTFTSHDYIQGDVRYDPHRKDVINLASFTVRERELQSERVIFEIDSPFSLAPNETRRIRVRSSDGSPFIDAVVPTTSDGQSEIQGLRANADALASTGTMNLSFGGEQLPASSKSSVQSSGINIFALASQIETALESLSTIKRGNVEVTGALADGDLTIAFGGELANLPLELIGVNATLAGSGAPEITAYRIQEGRKHGIVLRSGALTGVALDRTGGEFVTLALTAGPDGAEVESLRIRAKPIAVVREHQIEQQVDTTDSQQRYGGKSFPNSIWPEIAADEAQALADWIVYMHQEPSPTLQFKSRSMNIADAGEIVAYQQAADISDRVHVTESQTGVDEDYWLEYRADNLNQFGIETEWGLARVWPDELVGNFARVGNWELGEMRPAP